MPSNLPYIAHAAIYFLFAAVVHAESALDLVDVQSIDPTIQVQLIYATDANITGRALYPPGFKAQLRRGVAWELKSAQDAVRIFGYSLKIWDAYRPLSAQKALHGVISDPRFVAEPGVRSMHNRGVAVDVTLVDPTGKEALMPTTFDIMTPAAFYHYRGKNPKIAENLRILQKVMGDHGFYACRTEWWHFFSRQWKSYPNILEIDAAPLEKNKSIPTIGGVPDL